MQELCICDIDGVIADSSVRFAKAEEVKQTYLEAHGISPEEAKVQHFSDTVKHANKLYWKTAFTPEWVTLDTLMEGVHLPSQVGGIARIGECQVFYLTSRPESLRAATISWFRAQGYPIYDDQLFMKTPSQTENFAKTVPWKCAVTEALARALCVKKLLFIDDEVANRTAITGAFAALNLLRVCQVAASLPEAAKIVEGWL